MRHAKPVARKVGANKDVVVDGIVFDVLANSGEYYVNQGERLQG